jgi:hypothetical protein
VRCKQERVFLNEPAPRLEDRNFLGGKPEDPSAGKFYDALTRPEDISARGFFNRESLEEYLKKDPSAAAFLKY